MFSFGGGAKKGKLGDLEDRASSAAEELESKRAQVKLQKRASAELRLERVHAGEELVEQSSKVSDLQSRGRELSAVLERAREQLHGEQAELSDSELVLKELRSEVADLQGKLRRFKQMHAALQLAQSHTSSASTGLGQPCPPAFKVAGGVQQLEGSSSDALQSELFSMVSEAVELEVETKMWQSSEESHRNTMKEVTSACDELKSKHADVVAAVEAAEAENRGLQAQVDAAKERMDGARQEFDKNKRIEANMSDAIVVQNIGMSALKFQYHSELGVLGTKLRQTAEQRRQVEALQLKRLNDIQTVTSDRRQAAAAAAAAEVNRRQTPATPPSSVPVEVSRPCSTAYVAPPSEATEGGAATSAARPDSAKSLPETLPRAMRVPTPDLRVPELRGSAQGGAPMSARLGHAGRLVVG